MHGKLALVGATDMHNHRSNLQVQSQTRKERKIKCVVEQQYDNHCLFHVY